MKRCAVPALGLITASVLGQAFNIDINAASGFGAGVPSATFGGAANQPGTWNSYATLGATVTLMRTDGSLSSVSARVSGQAAALAADDTSASGEYAKLVEDGFRINSADGELRIDLWGLPQGIYAVYVYADDPADTAAHSRIQHGWGEITVGGEHGMNQFASPATHAVPFISVGDSVSLQVLNNVAFGSRGVLTGIQIVPVSGRVYVNASAPVGGDGRSWAGATRELRQLLEMCSESPGAIDEIWVARGTYLPMDSQYASFHVSDGMQLYGGFAGTETSPAQRNISANPSILSGEIGTAAPDDNCMRVVTFSLCNSGTVLDGFTVTGAYDEDGWNGGIYITDSQVDIRNCRIVDNYGYFGAGMTIDASTPRVDRCVFEGNFAGNGGAVYCGANGAPRFTHCDFRDNECDNKGGAIAQDGDGDLFIANCRFLGNRAGAGGGAVAMMDGDLFLTNCVLQANSSASGPGGAVRVEFSGSATLTNCTATTNHCNVAGGGLAVGSSSTLQVSNSILYGNTDLDGDTSVEFAQLHRFDGGTAGASSCLVQGWSGAIPGSANFSANPLLADVDGADNVMGTFDDNPRLAPGSPCIDRGSNGLIAADFADIDRDGNVAEPLPLDLAGQARRQNDPATPDQGQGSAPIVDLGAYEFGGACNLAGDLNGDGTVSLADLASLLTHFGMASGATLADGDVSGDGDVDLHDLALLLPNFGASCP